MTTIEEYKKICLRLTSQDVATKAQLFDYYLDAAITQLNDTGSDTMLSTICANFKNVRNGNYSPQKHVNDTFIDKRKEIPGWVTSKDGNFTCYRNKDVNFSVLIRSDLKYVAFRSQFNEGLNNFFRSLNAKFDYNIKAWGIAIIDVTQYLISLAEIAEKSTLNKEGYFEHNVYNKKTLIDTEHFPISIFEKVKQIAEVY